MYDLELFSSIIFKNNFISCEKSDKGFSFIPILCIFYKCKKFTHDSFFISIWLKKFFQIFIDLFGRHLGIARLNLVRLNGGQQYELGLGLLESVNRVYRLLL